MVNNYYVRIKKIIISNILSLCIPVVVNTFFQADLHILKYFYIPLIINALFFVHYYYSNKLALIAGIIIITTYSIAAVSFFIFTVSIPYSAYAAWISLVKEGSSGGIISSLFITGILYFSTLLTSLIYRYNYVRPLSGLGFVISVFYLIIYQNGILAAFTIIILIITILSTISRDNEQKIKTILLTLRFIGIVIGLSLLLTVIRGNRSGWLRYYALDPELRNIIETMIPDFPVFSGIEGFGSSYGEKILGAKPILSPRPVFEVKAQSGRMIYLRSQAFDVYTGYSWTQSRELIAPPQDHPRYFSVDPTREPDIEITTIIDYFSFIPHTLRTNGITITDNSNPKLYYGKTAAGFKFELPIIKNTHITLYEDVSHDASPDVLSDDELTRYLGLSKFLPDQVKTLGKTLGADMSSQMDVLNEIYHYLSSTCQYSLEANQAEDDDLDFVENFVFKNQYGCCQHFASAFTLLARLNNIPARYVTGYVVSIPFRQNRAICTGMTKHAWSEVYLKDKGWTTWEATPPFYNAAAAAGDYFTRYNPDNNVLIDTQLRAIRGMINEDKKESGKNFPFKYIIVSIIIGILLTLLYVLLWIKKRRKKHTLSVDKEIRKVQKIVKKIIKVGRKNKIPHPEEIGYQLWFDKLSAVYSLKQKNIDRALDIIQMTFYSEKKPQKNEITYLRYFYNMLQK